MARPLKSGLEYFPHDCDASTDEKIESLVSVCGLVGYAFYFKMLERIYRTSTGELDLSESLQRSIAIKKIGLSEKKFEKILETCLKLKLFDEDLYKTRKSVTSNGIQRRFSQVLKMRGVWRNTKSFPQGKPYKENPTDNSGRKTGTKLNKTKEDENVFGITETQKYFFPNKKQLSESESKVVV
jgi:hypothetical protein